MTRIVEVPLTVNNLKLISKDINKVIKALESPKLMKFFEKKLLDLIKEISIEKIQTLSEDTLDTSTYMKGFGSEIKGDTIYIYNNSIIDMTDPNVTKRFKDKSKLENYPLQLSLAKIVEYGVGIEGANTPQDSVGNWEYDVNNHGMEGWYYQDGNGTYHWTRGYEGKLIFHTFETRVKENANKWFDEYLKEYL